MSPYLQEVGTSKSHLSEIERGIATNTSIEMVGRISKALQADVVIQSSYARELHKPIAYESPFTLEELTKTGKEYSGQSVVRQVQEILKDPQIPIQQRRLLGKQIASLVKVVKEEVQSEEANRK